MRTKAIVILLVLLVAGAIPFLMSNMRSTNSEKKLIQIKEQMSLTDLQILVEKELGIKVYPSFEFWCKWKGYNKTSNTYLMVEPNTSFLSVIALLKRYSTGTFDWVLRSSWTEKELVKSIAAKYNWQEQQVFDLLSNDSLLSIYGCNKLTWHKLFIANTYNLKYAYTPQQWLERMYSESQKFWKNRREVAAKNQSKVFENNTDVVILASIVTKESNAVKEFGKIAGVYKNRLEINQLLQADPTVVFARGRTGRVLKSDTKIESPYNTYIHKGLPPGPLCIPDPKAIDSCLFGSTYPYFYFCAKPDNSGTHNFARTLQEHDVNAAKYHRWLNGR